MSDSGYNSVYKDQMRKDILECPLFLYSYSPTGLTTDIRYVFTHKTFTGRNALVDAWTYAVGI